MEINLHKVPKRFHGIFSKAIRMTLKACKKYSSGEISIIMVSDKEIKQLNRKYRNVNRITDVISFKIDGEGINKEELTGDIYIANNRSRRQAKEQGNSWEKELAYLVAHGVLHLHGYSDYEPSKRKEMFELQDKIWQCLYF